MKKSLITLSKLSAALAVAYASMPAYADIMPANGQTKVSKQSGVEIVNIAAPSAAGLSHNQYQKFNVGTQGAVLNNAQQAGRSELAGQLGANPHLNQRSAAVILNEVVSRNPSTIAGQQEIFGQRADYVLANPNGISVQGGGFINTSRASLVVGKPEVTNGALNGFDVSGESSLSTSGKMSGQLDQLDLIAPKVQIQSDISGSHAVNVIGGKNKINRGANGQLDIQVQKVTGAVLDGKVAGSIQANRIRIHNTDERATLAISGAELTASDLAISAGNARLSGEIEKKFDSSSRNYTADKRVKTQETHSTQTQTLRPTKLKSDGLLIDVTNNLTVAAGDIQAKSAIIRSGQATLGVQTTTNSTTSTINRSKGLWYRNDSTETSEQTRHQTKLNVDDLTLVTNKGKLVAEAVKFENKNALLFGEKGVELKGLTQQRKQTQESNYRNETAKLKSGRNYVNSDEQTLLTTDFNVENNLRIASRKEVSLAAVKGQIDGNLFVENNGKATFTSQTSRTKREIDDKEKYWGGLGGANSGSASVDELTQHGTDLTVKGLAYISTENGAQISGSRVLAGEGYVHASGGDLVIDSVKAQTTAQTSARKGTIFNITKARSEDFSAVTTSQGSILSSESNLKLLTDKDVSVVGSKVLASGVLDLTAAKINVSGATNQSDTSHSAYALGLSRKVEKPTMKNNIEGLVNEVINTWLDGKMVEKPLDLFFKYNTFSTGAGVTLGAKNTVEKVNTTTVSGSQLQGSSVTAQGEQISLSGSKVNATGGDVTLAANQIVTKAQTETTQTETTNTEVGLTIGAKLTEKNVSTYATLGVNHSETQSQSQNAAVSAISAVGDVVLNADKIVHQGSKLNAGGSVSENAQSIRHETAQTTNTGNSKEVNAGLTYTFSVNKDKSQVHSVALNASGARENSLSQAHTATEIQSGKDISITAATVKDSATAYQAGQNVTIQANEYALQAVQNSEQKESLKAGATLGVSATTTDYKSATLAVNAGANYQQAKSEAEKAQLGGIQAQNVAISADNIALQGNINATNSVALTAAQALSISQGNDSSKKSGGGFDASVSVGGIATAGAVIPSVSVGVNANGEKGQSQTAVTNQISANNIVIQAGQNADLQAVNLQGQNVAISAQAVNVAAAQSSASLNAGSAGVSVSVGKDVASVAASGKFSAKVEKETTHSAAQINAQNVAINAQNGVTLSGVNTQAENVALNGGNGAIVLNALQNQVHKTGVSASLALNGDMKDKQWNAKGGSASVAVDVVRNDTHTASQVNAANVALNTQGDMVLNGSVINANRVEGNVGGNVVSTAATDKISETSVSLSASGSGKYTAYPTDKWALSLKKDWDNGAIAGIKGDAAAAVKVVRKQRGLPTGVNTLENKLNVGGTTVNAATAPTQDFSYDNALSLTTNLKGRYYLPWRKQQFGQ